VVNTVTKSGTNQFHGDGYYYILDSALDANDKVNEENGSQSPRIAGSNSEARLAAL
jgi:hypothetical protein